jgi:hypothetical protein
MDIHDPASFGYIFVGIIVFTDCLKRIDVIRQGLQYAE